MEVGRKFAPLTSKVKAVSVALLEEGESDEIIGVGLITPEGPWAMAKPAPPLSAESVHAGPVNGMSIPEGALMEKPKICAKPLNPDAYAVDAVKAKVPLGSTTMEAGLIPSAYGEPGT